MNEINKEVLRRYSYSNVLYNGIFDFKYSADIKYLIENCRCLWLICEIWSLRNHPQVIGRTFQIWTLRKKGEKEALLYFSENNKEQVLIMEYSLVDIWNYYENEEIKIKNKNGVLSFVYE